jgi:hypothetical protein
MRRASLPCAYPIQREVLRQLPSVELLGPYPNQREALMRRMGSELLRAYPLQRGRRNRPYPIHRAALLAVVSRRQICSAYPFQRRRTWPRVPDSARGAAVPHRGGELAFVNALAVP